MEKTTKYYNIAEWLVVIHFVDGVNSDELLPSFRVFEISEEESKNIPLLFQITVDDNFFPETKGNEVGQFDCGGNNHGVYRREDGRYQFVVSNYLGFQCSLMECTVDFKSATVALAGEWSDRNFGLNNCMMMLYAFAGSSVNTLMFHSSVVRKDGKGYLFLGKSGTGKSTHTQLWLKYISDTDLMNDDNPVVRYIDGKTYVYGSPWSGKTPCYRKVKAEVGAFVRLNQEPTNNIHQLKGLEAFAVLMPSCSTMKWDRPVFNGVCDIVSRVLTTSKMYFMGCLPDEAAAQLSYNTIAK